MKELLLEMYSEEIPARMQFDAEQAYTEIFHNYFKKHDLNHGDLKVYIGPRRITLHVENLPTTLPAKQIEVRGPKVDAPKQALEGFCNSYRVELTQLEIREVKGNQFYFLVQNEPEKQTADVLKSTLTDPIGEYVWSKSMFWGNYKIKWVRPLKNILCLFDGKIIDFEYGHLKANDQTFGHRFMSPAPFAVKNFEEYRQKLVEKFVIIDRQERLKIIQDGLSTEATKKGLTIKDDLNLLEEVAGLAEYPIVLRGNINEKFLQVPSEVLVTSMRSHQKYFSTFNNKGEFAPYFLFVTNIISPEPESIIQGNEKVLSARLSDALYFYNQDLKTTLEARKARLNSVVFHEKLGTLFDKVQRVEKICHIIDKDNQTASIAAKLCKSDILTEVVCEFPNLQGIMGYYYAKAEGLDEDIAAAIRDHYKPVGANDSVPTKSASIILALADKIDSLCGLMLAGEKPTGSKDPYALRRTALGIIRIIMENKIKINLNELTDFAINNYQFNAQQAKITHQEILLFIEERVKNYLKNSFDHKVIDAALDLSFEPDLVIASEKITALNTFLQEKLSTELMICYKRSNNIIDSEKVALNVDSSLLKSSFEQELFAAINKAETHLNNACADKNYAEALKILAALYQPLANFFDNVLVKDEDRNIAVNRLALLYKVKQSFEKVAKFDRL